MWIVKCYLIGLFSYKLNDVCNLESITHSMNGSYCLEYNLGLVVWDLYGYVGKEMVEMLSVEVNFLNES